MSTVGHVSDAGGPMCTLSMPKLWHERGRGERDTVKMVPISSPPSLSCATGCRRFLLNAQAAPLVVAGPNEGCQDIDRDVALRVGEGDVDTVACLVPATVGSAAVLREAVGKNQEWRCEGVSEERERRGALKQSPPTLKKKGYLRAAFVSCARHRPDNGAVHFHDKPFGVLQGREVVWGEVASGLGACTQRCWSQASPDLGS